MIKIGSWVTVTVTTAAPDLGWAVVGSALWHQGPIPVTHNHSPLVSPTPLFDNTHYQSWQKSGSKMTYSDPDRPTKQNKNSWLNYHEYATYYLKIRLLTLHPNPTNAVFPETKTAYRIVPNKRPRGVY